GVSPGSARTVGTPSQPPPAFAGGGAKAKLAAPAAPAWLLPPRAILPIPRRCRRYAAARPYPRRPLSRRAAPGSQRFDAILPQPGRGGRYAAARPYQRRQLSRRAAPG